ncbi:hypothetical protein [Cellulomonas sp. B6]|jgi:hypothetical protein|uniref:hypothetical protein n=1 Tax=Cellulomonas sp. B6 TaxID=1295626 RepID=UPI000A7D996C|nr:hypothetical protein [Cellulomonas sp. B6]
MDEQGERQPPWGWVAGVFSAIVLAAGVAVGVTTGEWWALLCASGLVILPLARRRAAS